MNSKIHPNSRDKIYMQRKLVENTESDLLVSCIRKNATSSSQRKGRASDHGHNDEANEVGEASDRDVSNPTIQPFFLSQNYVPSWFC